MIEILGGQKTVIRDGTVFLWVRNEPLYRTVPKWGVEAYGVNNHIIDFVASNVFRLAIIPGIEEEAYYKLRENVRVFRDDNQDMIWEFERDGKRVKIYQILINGATLEIKNDRDLIKKVKEEMMGY